MRFAEASTTAVLEQSKNQYSGRSKIMHDGWIKLHLKGGNDLFVVKHGSVKIMASSFLRSMFDVD